MMSPENTVAIAEAPPAWLQSVMDQFEQKTADRITAVQNELRGEIDDRIAAAKEELRDEISGLRDEIRDVRRLAVLNHIKTARRDNGYFNDANDLDEVPFADGTFPWNETVAGPTATDNIHLPPLSSVQAVSNLSKSEVYGYYKGYYPGESNIGTSQIRRKKILTAIGRRDVMPPSTA